MNPKLCALCILMVASLLSAPQLQAQDDATNDTDLTKMLKEAQEMQKEVGKMQQENPAAPGRKKTMAEMEAESKANLAHMEAEEKKEKEQLQAALKKQLAESGPAALPDWTPKTPQFTETGSVVKKIVDDEVKIIQTGTSTLTPKELADGWEAAAEATGKLNHVRNNISSNDNITTIMFLSTRTSPEEKVEMEARRGPGEKISHIEITSPLPKPEIASE